MRTRLVDVLGAGGLALGVASLVIPRGAAVRSMLVLVGLVAMVVALFLKRTVSDEDDEVDE